MKYNPAILRSAREEWSDWLEMPECSPSFTIKEMRCWVENRPPISAFSSLTQIIDLMQDEIDLLNIRLKELAEELKEARIAIIKRI